MTAKEESFSTGAGSGSRIEDSSTAGLKGKQSYEMKFSVVNRKRTRLEGAFA